MDSSTIVHNFWTNDCHVLRDDGMSVVVMTVYPRYLKERLDAALADKPVGARQIFEMSSSGCPRL